MAEVIDTKPWYTSQTVWAGVTGFFASAGGAYAAWKAGNINEAMTAIVAAVSALGAIVGRFKATGAIK
jgi:uncharacterized membrane protein YfcA